MEFNIGGVQMNVASDCNVCIRNGSEVTKILPAVKPKDQLQARLAARASLSPYQPPTNSVSCLLYDQSCTTKPPGWYKQHFINQALSFGESMHSVDLVGHHGCINSLAFSPGGDEFLATAGDDKRVLFWRMAEVTSGSGRGLKSLVMDTEHTSNIFSSTFSCDGAFLYTGGDDTDLIKHDFTRFQSVSSQQVGVYHHMDSVYCVAAHPSSPHIVYTASQDGCVYIIDTRHAQSDSFVRGDMVLCKDLRSYQCVSVNPTQPCLVGVAGSGCGVGLYDTRKMKRVQRYRNPDWFAGRESAVSVCFNQTGTQLLSLYRDTGPCLFDLHRTTPTQVFTAKQYRNMVTLKSGCFMGQNDEYVVSGSDDFRVYMWKVAPSGPDSARFTEPHLILPGHRSIVNQIRYSTAHQVMTTSGVEKIVKVWSHLPLRGDDVTHKSGDPPSRERFTSRQQIRDFNPPSPAAEGTEEDATVLYLFDSMVEQAENGELPDSSLSSAYTVDDSEGSIDSDDSEFDDDYYDGDPLNLVWPSFWGPWSSDDSTSTELDVSDEDYRSESHNHDTECSCGECGGDPWVPDSDDPWMSDVDSSDLEAMFDPVPCGGNTPPDYHGSSSESSDSDSDGDNQGKVMTLLYFKHSSDSDTSSDESEPVSAVSVSISQPSSSSNNASLASTVQGGVSIDPSEPVRHKRKRTRGSSAAVNKDTKSPRKTRGSKKEAPVLSRDKSKELTRKKARVNAKPGASSSKKTKPAASGPKKAKPTTSASKKAEPAASAVTKAEPTASTVKKAEPAASASKKAEPAASTVKKAEPAASGPKKAKPAASAAKKRKSASYTAPPAAKKAKVMQTTKKTAQRSKGTEVTDHEAKVGKSSRKKPSGNGEKSVNNTGEGPSELPQATSGDSSHQQSNGRSKKGKDSSTRSHVKKHPASEDGQGASNGPTTRSRRNIEP